MTRVEFPPRLSVARLPTPVRPLRRLSAQWGGPTLWIKHDDDTGGPLSGNKIRKLQYAVRKAIDEGADTLVTCGGIQSNHCRATAVLARRMGLRIRLVLRGEAPAQATGNLLLDQVLGARIDWVTPAQYRERSTLMETIAQQERETGHRPFVIPEGCSMPVGSWGYISAAQEIAEAQREHGITFDAIVNAVGSGGTSAGLAIGLRMFELSARLYGVNVCDDAAYFERRVSQLIQQTAEQYALPSRCVPDVVEFIDGYVGRGYAKTRPEELRVIHELASTEGVVLDPVYTGKAMFALRDTWHSDRFAGAQNVLFIHTGGIYGLFAHAESLAGILPSGS